MDHRDTFFLRLFKPSKQILKFVSKFQNFKICQQISGRLIKLQNFSAIFRNFVQNCHLPFFSLQISDFFFSPNFFFCSKMYLFQKVDSKAKEGLEDIAICLAANGIPACGLNYFRVENCWRPESQYCKRRLRDGRHQTEV